MEPKKILFREEIEILKGRRTTPPKIAEPINELGFCYEQFSFQIKYIKRIVVIDLTFNRLTY